MLLEHENCKGSRDMNDSFDPLEKSSIFSKQCPITPLIDCNHAEKSVLPASCPKKDFKHEQFYKLFEKLSSWGHT